MNRIRAAISETGRATVWRNPVGFDQVHGQRYGLAVGSSDLVGFVHGTGRVFFVEVKMPKGRVSEEQELFLSHVIANGALGGIARSEQEALEIVFPHEA